MVHGAKTAPEHVSHAANQIVCVCPPPVLLYGGIVVNIRNEHGNVIMVCVTEQDLKGSVVVKPRQRVVERVVGIVVFSCQISLLFLERLMFLSHGDK
jgi:hypothetical protein